MNARDLIQRHEGRVAHAYADSLGYLTIGVGHLVDERKGGGLPDEIIDALFDYDFRKHRDQMMKVLPWAAALDEVREAVLVNMAFQLGSKLYAFVETLRHLQAGSWNAAADAMLDSAWAKQTPARAQELAQMVRTGEWPK